MARMTTSISLALISSSLIFAGCAGEPPPGKESDKEKDKEEHAARGTSRSSRSGAYYHPWYFGGSSWGRSAGRAGASTSRPGSSGAIHSGGFGSTGHAAGT